MLFQYLLEIVQNPPKTGNHNSIIKDSEWFKMKRTKN